jgi:hypothetical protein
MESLAGLCIRAMRHLRSWCPQERHKNFGDLIYVNALISLWWQSMPPAPEP